MRLTMSERDLPDRFMMDGFVVDQSALRIVTPTGEVSLEPKVMSVLTELASQAGSVVTRQYLIETVWQVSYGGDESLTRAISILRKTLGDTNGKRNLIETVPRRGYRLMADVKPDAPSSRSPTSSKGDAPPVERAPVEVEPKSNAPRQPRMAVLLVAAGVFAAVVLAGIVWEMTRTTASAPAGNDQARALARFEISPTAELSLAEGMPGFQESLLTTNRLWHAFDLTAKTARYEFLLSAGEQEPGGTYQLVLTQAGMTRALFETEFTAAGMSHEALAERIVVLASHLMRCGEDLISSMSLDSQSDHALLGMLFALCHTNVGSVQGESADQLSARMLERFPNEPGVRALRAVIILSRPDRHWMGQRDIRQPEIQEEARRLLNDARGSMSARQIVEIGDILLAAKQAELAEQEALLSEIGASNWLALGAVSLRNAMLRQAGRLTEAEYLLTVPSAAWPSSTELLGGLAIVQAQRGAYSEAVSTLESALRLRPDSMMLIATRDVLTTFYGDPVEAQEMLKSAPPVVQSCLNAFLDVRMKLKTTLGAECDQQELTQRARSLAIIGEYERAQNLIELFDPAASGVGMVLYYPEFRPLWQDDRMWNVARKFGFVDYWLETETRPDMCYLEAFLELCAEKIR